LFAFDDDKYPPILTEFYQFAKDYYKQHGYRSNLLYVGYRIAKDQQSLLSYSFDSNVMTLDPVSTGNPGWDDFLLAYNQFCLDRNGKPLLNQTPGLTPDVIQRVLGARLESIGNKRKEFDPGGRLLNDYWKGIFA
jgi:hypothetical protein